MLLYVQFAPSTPALTVSSEARYPLVASVPQASLVPTVALAHYAQSILTKIRVARVNAHSALRMQFIPCQGQSRRRNASVPLGLLAMVLLMVVARLAMQIVSKQRLAMRLAQLVLAARSL